MCPLLATILGIPCVRAFTCEAFSMFILFCKKKKKKTLCAEHKFCNSKPMGSWALYFTDPTLEAIAGLNKPPKMGTKWQFLERDRV